MTRIVLRSLTKRFGQTPAVVDVNLDVKGGELFFLLGPSGCGKTTLLRMVAGFVTPTSGTIQIGEHEVTDQPAHRRQCGMVFQNYALWPHLTVRQNVAFGLDVRRLPAAEKRLRTEDALRMVQLDDEADRKPNELSGGQQQRVALARALVIRPTALLLDEPLSNLDARLRQRMRDEIKQICKQAGITTIYVTHDQKEALAMADRIALMRDGRVIQIDKPWNLYHRPVNRFVAEFLGETNLLSATITRMENQTMKLDTPAGPVWSEVFPKGLETDRSVTCSLRPEAIRLLRGEQDTADNMLPGRLVGTTYLGELAQHRVMVGETTPLIVYELNPSADTVEIGRGNCRIGFSARDVVVLAEP